MKLFVHRFIAATFLVIIFSTSVPLTAYAQVSASTLSSLVSSLQSLLSSLKGGQSAQVISPTISGSSIPSNIANLQPGHWLELQNTKIRSVLPSGPTGNPINITDAWSGGTVDTLRNRMIVWGGGHSDYSGNEVYAINLSDSSVTRLTNPASSPASRHTYGGLTYIAHADKMYASGGSTYPNGNVDNTTWLLNFANTTPSWEHDTDATPFMLSFGMIAKYDASTQKVYAYDRDDLFTYNVSNGNYTHLASGPSLSLDASGTIDSLRRRLVLVDGGTVSYINLDSPYATGVLATSNNPSALSNRSPGFSYDSAADKLVLWAGGNNVYTVPAAGGAWSQVRESGGPGTSQMSTGTYGRWEYVPSYGVFVLVNSIDENAWVFKSSQSTTPSDTTAPSVPTSLVVNPVSSSRLDLSWTASTDNIAVTGYEIFRNGTNIATVTTPSTTYQDTSLTTSTSYTYTVRAKDAASNVSAQTAGVQGVTLASSGGSLPAGCALETSLSGRADIIHCEPWSNTNWWQNGYLDDGTVSRTYPALGPDETEIVSTGCVSGTCLKANMKSWREGGAGGALAHHWPIPGDQEDVYLRYYIKFAPNWDPGIYDLSGESNGSGGKFPGLADVRTDSDPSGQCGNGGAFSDGINCWSARLKYRDCIGSGGADVCAASSNETTRLGYYWYLPPVSGNNNQAFGSFDNISWGTDGYPCSASPTNIGSSGSDSTSCGKGAAGLANNQWYLVELHTKMNTPGQANGVAEAWIDGVLKYSKNNVEYRKVGHDNLHVRSVWLNVHAGGESVGPEETTAIYLDQMVVATGARPGAFPTVSLQDTTSPSVPSSSVVDTNTAVTPTVSSGGGGGGGGVGKPKPTTTVTNSITSSLPSAQTPVNTQNFVTSLFMGSRNDEVKKLQQFLIKQGFLASDSATGFYGVVTEAAVKKYQCARNIVCGGTGSSTGYGLVGNLTRAQLNREVIIATDTVPTTYSQLSSEQRQVLIQSLLQQVQVLMTKLKALRGS